jgi:hypothetical protein
MGAKKKAKKAVEQKAAKKPTQKNIKPNAAQKEELLAKLGMLIGAMANSMRTPNPQIQEKLRAHTSPPMDGELRIALMDCLKAEFLLRFPGKGQISGEALVAFMAEQVHSYAYNVFGMMLESMEADAKAKLRVFAASHGGQFPQA